MPNLDSVAGCMSLRRRVDIQCWMPWSGVTTAQPPWLPSSGLPSGTARSMETANDDNERLEEPCRSYGPGHGGSRAHDDIAGPGGSAGKPDPGQHPGADGGDDS